MDVCNCCGVVNQVAIDSTIMIRPEEVCPLVASLIELLIYAVGFDDGVPLVSDYVSVNVIGAGY